MADIKQAAKWMEEGKTVKRSVYKPGLKTGFDDLPLSHPEYATSMFADGKGRIVSSDFLPVSLMLAALLAEDWEIAE